MALVDNKEKIQALLAGINALPEAGSGEPAEPVLQEKSVTPTKAAQSVTPDTGYDGLSNVNVGAIPDEYIVPSGTVSITENGTHNVREAESVSVNVSAPVTEPVLQEKTVSPATSSQTVRPDNGYDGLSQVTVSAMPTATQATPSISVNSSGLITASATQSAGYVAAGTKSATKQLTTQAAQTITPGTSDKTIASGRYLTGTQTIKGDANLTAANIAKGISIFGVTGTHEGGEDISEAIEGAVTNYTSEMSSPGYYNYTLEIDGLESSTRNFIMIFVRDKNQYSNGDITYHDLLICVAYRVNKSDDFTIKIIGNRDDVFSGPYGVVVNENNVILNDSLIGGGYATSGGTVVTFEEFRYAVA